MNALPSTLPTSRVAVPPSTETLRRFFLPYSPRQRALVAAIDVVVLALGGAVALLAADQEASIATGVFLARAAVLALVGLIGLHAADCYDARAFMGFRELAARLVLGVLIAIPAGALVAVLFPSLELSNAIAPAAMVWIATTLPVRWAADEALRHAGGRERIVLLGLGKLGVEAARAIARIEGDDRILGWVGPRGPRHETFARTGPLRALPVLAYRRGVTRAVIDADALGPLTDRAIVAATQAGIPWVEAGELLERLSGRALLERLDPRWIVHASGLETGTLEQVAFRRVVEVVISAAALIALSPVLIATALAIKLGSKGPVFFVQERVGRGGRPFRLLKFRTMRTDAEAQSGPVWAQARDPRVTPIGRILRKTRLDELPQLWNVLRGDMSFIGPRPERAFFVEKIAAIEPAFRLRHVVRPGVTGWAQVKYRYGASVEDAIEKLRYDLYYIFRWTPLLDIEVLVETVRVVLRGSNDH